MEVRFYQKPELKSPCLIAAWPGMGLLAKLSADHLVRQLNAKPFAEVRSPRNDIAFEDGLGELGVDRHRFYYWRGEPHNLIICSGENQPQSLEAIQRLANQVLDVAQQFRVKRIYTFAAIPSHQEEPKVFCVVNNPELKNPLEKYGVRLTRGAGRITGLNGVLIGAAQQRGIDGICLLCEIRYLDIPQPRSAISVLKALTKLLGVKVDLSNLEHQAQEVEEKMERIKTRRPTGVARPSEPGYIS